VPGYWASPEQPDFMIQVPLLEHAGRVFVSELPLAPPQMPLQHGVACVDWLVQAVLRLCCTFTCVNLGSSCDVPVFSSSAFPLRRVWEVEAALVAWGTRYGTGMVRA
jgi:hypothetical protein